MPDCRQHQQTQLSDLAECPYCGQVGGIPVTLEDSDDSVGYHDIIEMCTLCAPKKKA